jgi:ParB-like chromosome segregation protein Spo0J
VAVLPQSYESVPIDTVHPHPDNPRRGDLAVITESITTNGFFGACVVQRGSGHILIGNHRWLAARDAGEPSVPVLWLDVDDNRAHRIMVADNRTAELSAWDNEQLLALLSELSEDGEGLAGVGFSDDDLANLAAHFGPPPDLDELIEEHGGPDEQNLWPVLRVKMPPVVMQRYERLAEATGGDDDLSRFLGVLSWAEQPAGLVPPQ